MPDPIDAIPTVIAPDPFASASSSRDETETASRARDAGPPRFAPPAVPGEVGSLGPYRVISELGRGGMGIVYLALDTRLDRRIALKVLLPECAADAESKERFLREAKAAALIGSDHVVTVFEADERDGVPYIAMQLLQGYSLGQYLTLKGAPPLPHVLRIGRETALGLAAAHALGVIHRDIKPTNLWLEAPHGRLKVLDFGLAKPASAETELTTSGAVVGSPAYMSPEQARGETVDARSDLFSLGSVLYRLCTGKSPFTGPTTMAVLMALGGRDPFPVRELNPNVPEPLARLIHQLLAKRPEERPQTATEVAKRLRSILEQVVKPPQAMAVAPAASPATAADVSTTLPVVVRSVPVQPPLVTPMQITPRPGNTALTPRDTEREETPTLRIDPPKKSGRRAVWLTISGAALLIVAVVMIAFRDKDNGGTPIGSPDDDARTEQEPQVLAEPKNDKPMPVAVAPEPRPAVPKPTDPDRRGAEYVLSIGGTVRVQGGTRDLRAPDPLPEGAFQLAGVTFTAENRVTDAGLAALKGCRHLTHLSVYGCPEVTDVGLAVFKNCRRLSHLSLHACPKITDAGLVAFKDCTNLHYLDLAGTKVTDAGLVHFKDCTNLRQLKLYRTQSSDAGLAVFKDCPHLSELTLSACPNVTDAVLAVLKDHDNLMDLNLGFTRVTGSGLGHLTGFPKLRSLSLASTAVTDASLTPVKDCPKLWHIDLKECPKVTDAALAILKECPQLARIDLTQTAVTDAGLLHLAERDTLTALNLTNTNVTATGVEKLQKALPNCKITSSLTTP